MTKLGVQGGPEEEVKQDPAKDPKVFTVVQPTFVPIPIQTTEPMRKSVPSTWCLMARLLAIVLVGSLLFSLLVFVVWNKDEVARAITGDKTHLSEPQFAALNSQVHAGEVVKKEGEKPDDGAQITIKQTGEGTQMIIQMPKADETKDGSKTADDTPAIPMLQLVPARERQQQENEGSDEGSQEMDDRRRPMHPYEMEGPSPDALNFGMHPGMMHPMMAMQAARAAQYENEMRAWRMRRLQQMLVLAAVQQAQQREAAMRYAFFQRQQWAQQQMAMQQAMEQRRQMEWQEYWRRAAIARMMQQQQAMQQMHFQQQQQQPVGAAWQSAEQPRPWWTQQQQPQMAFPQQQFVQQAQWQGQQQPGPMMQQHPFWMQQQQQQMQQQPAFEPQGGAQVPQSQPLFLFQQALQARLRERMQQQLQQQSMQHMQQHQEMQPQQQSDEESREEPQQPQPHAFIFIRRFFPIPQDSREQQQPAVSSEESSNEKNIPLRPHDASAQQIVEQMRGGQGPNALPDAPLPGIHDRIFQHFQTLSQQMQDRSGQSQAQSQPPLFASIPNSVEQNSDSRPQESQSQENHNYDQDAIYEKLQRKAMQLQQDGPAIVQPAADSGSSSSSASESHSKEDSSQSEDDHDIRRGDAVLGAFDRTAQVDSDLKTTTEPVMIENFVRAQAQQEKESDDDNEDELTPEEKRKVAQIDSAELKEAAALEASLEREANMLREQKDKHEAEMVKVEEEIVHDANKDSSSSEDDKSAGSEKKKESEEKEEEAPTTVDPLSEFFRFFENEAVKLSAQDKQAERVVVDSETGTHHPDEQLPSMDASKDSEEVSASIDSVAPVSNEADIKVSQVATSHELPPMTIHAAA